MGEEGPDWPQARAARMGEDIDWPDDKIWPFGQGGPNWLGDGAACRTHNKGWQGGRATVMPKKNTWRQVAAGWQLAGVRVG